MSQKKLKKIRKNKILEKIVELEKVGEVAVSNGIRYILKENWKLLLVILLVTAGVFANGMRGDFVSDDYATIMQNPEVKDFWFTLKNYPNMIHMSNALVAAFFGNQNSAPFHIYSLLVYLMICVVMFIFIYQNMGRSLAILTLILFCIHPIHVEAVTWISGKPYLMTTLFCLLSLITLKEYSETGKRKYLIAFLFMLFIAYKSEGARFLTLFFLVPMMFFYRGLKRVKIDIKKVAIFLALLLPFVLIYVWPKIMGRINVVNSGYNVSESIFYNPLFQYPTAVTKYLQLLTVPVDLTLYHTMYTFPVWLNWVVFLLYLANLGYFYFKEKKIFFGLLFIFVASISSMTPVKVAWLVAERYMFFGSIGFCLFVAILLNKIGERNKYVAIGLTSIILIIFAARIYFRNTDWNTNHNLWVNTCLVSPNSHNAWNNIGDDYDKLKSYDNAVKGFTQSTLVKPNYADAYHNRANILFKVGRLDLARESYNIALNFSPTLFQTYLSLTQIDLMEGKYDLGIVHASKASELQPDNPQTAYVLGVVYAEKGMKDEALNLFNKILQKYPDYTLAAEAIKRIK